MALSYLDIGTGGGCARISIGGLESEGIVSGEAKELTT
jgi:hypothetical protein